MAASDELNRLNKEIAELRKQLGKTMTNLSYQMRLKKLESLLED
jgi:hypothetical protein